MKSTQIDFFSTSVGKLYGTVNMRSIMHVRKIIAKFLRDAWMNGKCSIIYWHLACFLGMSTSRTGLII